MKLEQPDRQPETVQLFFKLHVQLYVERIIKCILLLCFNVSIEYMIVWLTHFHFNGKHNYELIQNIQFYLLGHFGNQLKSYNHVKNVSVNSMLFMRWISRGVNSIKINSNDFMMPTQINPSISNNST